MRHNRIIKLISVSITEDAIGNQIETPTEREIFANEFYVSSGEFYNAAVTGLKPEKMFEIYSYEYQGEEKLKHDDKIYNIIRTEARGDKIRLTCEKILADEGTPFAAYLASLTVGILPLVPAFSPAIIAYIVRTTNANDVITAIPQDQDATIVVKLNNVAMTNGAVATWIAGTNTVTVTVTNGTDTMIYTVTVIKT